MEPDTQKDQTTKPTNVAKGASLFAAITLPLLAAACGGKPPEDAQADANAVLNELNQPAVTQVLRAEEMVSVAKPEYQDLALKLDAAYRAAETAKNLTNNFSGDRQLYTEEYDEVRGAILESLRSAQQAVIEAAYDDTFQGVHEYLGDLSKDLGTVAGLIEEFDLTGLHHRNGYKRWSEVTSTLSPLFDLQGSIKLVQFGLSH